MTNGIRTSLKSFRTHQLEDLGKAERMEEAAGREEKLSTELDEWLAGEELLWKQISRMD